MENIKKLNSNFVCEIPMNTPIIIEKIDEQHLGYRILPDEEAKTATEIMQSLKEAKYQLYKRDMLIKEISRIETLVADKEYRKGFKWAKDIIINLIKKL